ncbi:inner membrane-spanning protein YciB [Tabrizicola fusiformis]|uniref:inner membrane-spanning protein YciB n=1 Tax=Tabrizicola sp. SY72 TaxID=2741673 RepID=UPI0015736851|nr:inner membrane-spanning protein YciB [Tabrizicola sp. SY72]NTT86025.1 septation protein IspZ [Tabrizicola sp. SY72]
MAEKKINPILKLALELGPVVLFFVMFGRLKDRTFTLGGAEYSGFIVTTAAFVLLIIATSALLWALTGKLSRMQMMTLVLVVVMGGLSVWLNDERFIKMKPTLLYLAFGGVLGFGLLRGQSYLRLVMDEALPMQPEGWMILTRRLTAFFFALAVANEAVWRLMSTEAWVNFKTFGLTAALFAFFMTQGKLFERYGNEPPKTGN